MIQFALGQLVITAGAEDVLQADEAVAMIRRHLTGDFGDMDAHDRRINYDEMRSGGRVLSRYKAASGDIIYVITEQWRGVTTILLPEEY